MLSFGIFGDFDGIANLVYTQNLQTPYLSFYERKYQEYILSYRMI